jgi:hypothetical protein
MADFVPEFLASCLVAAGDVGPVNCVCAAMTAAYAKRGALSSPNMVATVTLCFLLNIERALHGSRVRFEV